MNVSKMCVDVSEFIYASPSCDLNQEVSELEIWPDVPLNFHNPNHDDLSDSLHLYNFYPGILQNNIWASHLQLAAV